MEAGRSDRERSDCVRSEATSQFRRFPVISAVTPPVRMVQFALTARPVKNSVLFVLPSLHHAVFPDRRSTTHKSLRSDQHDTGKSMSFLSLLLFH
ncbi:unnamed protein product [Linum trigynum]|uniref:Uncharacterized protein n=1 Tax=Linum trigynum TaxID=586398 RepID=A0AAV2CWQ8_9ROSI